MPTQPLRVIAWIVVPVFAFVLGWLVRPTGPDADAAATAGRSGYDPAATPGGAPHSARADGRRPSGLRASGVGVRGAAADRPGAAAGADRELTSAQIEAIGERVRSELDPIKRREHFARLIAGLTLENAAEIRAQIAHLSPGSAEFKDFHYAWGALAGAEAVMHGTKTAAPDIHVTLAGWAAADPSAALAWFEGLQPKGKGYETQAYMARGLVDGLANRDIAAATDLVYSLAAAGHQQAPGLMHMVREKMLATTDPVDAIQWAAGLPEGRLRYDSMDHMARAYVRSDRKAATDWAIDLQGDPGQPRVVRAVGEELARRDPGAGIGWFESLPDIPGRNAGIAAVVGGWAARDPKAASQHLVGMDPSPARDVAIGSLVGRIAVRDPESAIIWAAEIEDPGTRQNTLMNAGRAMLKADPDRARLWLPVSGLSAAQQQQVILGGG